MKEEITLEYTLYLGSYTKKESKGIHQIILDTEKGVLRDYQLIAEVDSPTYLTLSTSKDSLYSVSKEGNGAGVTSFQRQSDGHYQKKSSNTSEEVTPCYISYDEERCLLYTASYHKGYVSVYKEKEDDSIELVDRIQHHGSSVHENQKSPHVHYSDLTPDHNYLLVCDLGTDGLYTYEILEDGKLKEVSRYTAKPGTGPRHLVFHPNGRTVYLLGELSSEIEVLEYERKDGSFTFVDRISTIPNSYTSFNGAAAIRVSKDGKYVYSSNRGHDSLAVFRVSDTDQTLSLIEIVPSEGNTPRDFNFSPNEGHIIVGHQDSDNLTLFKRDSLTGTLTLLQKDVYAPECVCITY